MHRPVASVLMPVYNGAKFLSYAIESILSQTFTDFTFVIVNDGSTDKTGEILAKYAKVDKRIIVMNLHKNVGIVAALNKGLTVCKGEYLFRMDADDVADPNRFDQQMSYMKLHPSCAVCGTWIKVVSDKGEYIWQPPVSSSQIKTSLFFESVIAHPSTCIRRKLIKNYDPKFEYVEDYALWVKLSHNYELANLPIPLLSYRSHLEQVSSVHSVKQADNLRKLKLVLLRELIPGASINDSLLHAKAMAWPMIMSYQELVELKKWYLHLISRNRETRLYNPRYFNKRIAEKWVGICYLAKSLGVKRYIYALSIPSLIGYGSVITISMRFHSLKEYTKATMKRLV